MYRELYSQMNALDDEIVKSVAMDRERLSLLESFIAYKGLKDELKAFDQSSIRLALHFRREFMGAQVVVTEEPSVVHIYEKAYEELFTYCFEVQENLDEQLADLLDQLYARYGELGALEKGKLKVKGVSGSLYFLDDVLLRLIKIGALDRDGLERLSPLTSKRS